ncbi:MAG: SLBB domain-containing protein [Ignavibacteriales bacterium]|nr:SLBB domain-containing protein [Ignavibacteriales bacterium]
MKKMFFYLSLLLLVIAVPSIAQTGDIKIGADMSMLRNAQGAFYDYSDPEALNIKVSVWGYVRFPGRYLVPAYINVRDLLSYAGGPTSDAFMNDMRIYRVLEDSTSVMYKFDYNDLMYSEKLTKVKEMVPDLRVGDLLVIPGEPKLYYRDYFSMTLSIVSTLISLAILVINIVK